MSRRKLSTPRVVREAVVTVCDRIGEALAHAHEIGDADQYDILVPALRSLWSLRWELQTQAGEEGGAT